MKERHNKKGRV